MRRAAELTIAVSVVLWMSRKLRAERMQHTDASDQMVRDQDQRMSALEHELDVANERATTTERLAQARVAATEARASRELELAQREMLKRERTIERRYDEAELRYEALQREAAMLRAMLQAARRTGLGGPSGRAPAPAQGMPQARLGRFGWRRLRRAKRESSSTYDAPPPVLLQQHIRRVNLDVCMAIH